MLETRTRIKIPLFVETLEGVDWSSLYDCENPNIVYNRFLELYTEIYNDCFPLKKVTRKQRRLRKPWLTKALLKSIKKKKYLYKKYLRVPSMDNDLRYKSYKNKLNHILRLSKGLYFEKKLEDVKSNTHATWKILNEILNRKKSNTHVNTVFRSEDLEISDPVEVANRFCIYFSSIGLNLSKAFSFLLVRITFYPDPFKNQSFLTQQQKMKLSLLHSLLLLLRPLASIISQCR